ncbi:MAG: transposase [Verrucomicrobiota bacterium]|mgnify:FL=1|nr:transposase [Verrucomicrobiota bacterium]
MSEQKEGGTGAEAPVENPRSKRRFSTRRKAEAVLRLLRGVDLETLSRELGVAAHELSRWRERFLAFGQAALKQRPGDDRDEEIRRLKTKVGDLTMDLELKDELIRRTTVRPFDGRRSKQ